MRLRELVLELSEKTGLSRRRCHLFLKILIEELQRGLKEERKIRLQGWGTLYARKTSQGWRLVFRASSRIKENLNR